MSFSRRAILRNWALTVPRCAVLCGRAPLWHPLTEGSQSFLAPLCLTEFLCLKHLQCLLVFSQFSSRLGDESPTGSWPEDKPKSPKECSIQDHAFFWRLRLLYKASLTVLETNACSLGVASLPAALQAPCSSRHLGIRHIHCPHHLHLCRSTFIEGKGHHFSFTPRHSPG